MALTPEAKVKNKVVKILDEYGAYYFRPAMGTYGKSGVPDLIVCYKGRFIGVEVKADAQKNKPTQLQLLQLQSIVGSGGISLVIDANNLDVLRVELEKLKGIN